MPEFQLKVNIANKRFAIKYKINGNTNISDSIVNIYLNRNLYIADNCYYLLIRTESELLGSGFSSPLVRLDFSSLP